jgi:diguanylate cyclase (GGDEF)-like protein
MAKGLNVSDLRVHDHDGLAARISVLRIAEKALQSNAPDALQTIRRISRSLLSLGETSQDPRVTEIASALDRASDAELGPCLHGLLPELRSLVANIRTQKAGLLIVDDDAVLREILQRRLAGPNRYIYTAATVAEAERVLADQDVGLVLLDLQLDDGDGRELLLKWRSSLPMSISIIVLTANRGPQVEAECLALGADGFFKKPVDYATLSTLVAAKLQQSVEIGRQSALDPLTGLPNRAAFQRAFARMAQLAKRYQEPLSVALLDIDRFKSINDLYGHPVGDRVLCRMTKTLSRSLRGSDLVARWGGEEFAVLFPKAGLEEARSALQKAQEALRKEQFEPGAQPDFHMTFSGGISLVRDHSTLDEVMAKADHFLYLAKQTGRNRVLTEADCLTALKKNILLVEDDDTTATILEHHLGRFGFNILRAKEGTEALRIVSETPVALLTLDLQMPGMNGFEFLQKLRQTPGISQIPVIILTWDADRRHMLEGFKRGADDYLFKPFSATEIHARIQRLLRD